jgi:predicted transcriptional regulator
MGTAYRGSTLKKKLAALGVGQRHLALVMGTNQPLISQLLNEQMPMPRGWSTRLYEAMYAIKARESGHYAGCGCRRGQHGSPAN